MSNIAILGITGRAGSRIATELLQRGHTVTGIARNVAKAEATPGLSAEAGRRHAARRTGAGAARPRRRDQRDPLRGRHRRRHRRRRREAGRRAAPAGGRRRRQPRGRAGQGAGRHARVPRAYKAEALAGRAFLEALRAEKELDWTFISPSALFEPGERTGSYRVGGNQLLADANGKSWISMEDYAIAMADEIENADASAPALHRRVLSGSAGCFERLLHHAHALVDHRADRACRRRAAADRRSRPSGCARSPSANTCSDAL